MTRQGQIHPEKNFKNSELPAITVLYWKKIFF